MSLGPLFRVLGTLLYGFIGYELGIALAGTTQLTSDNAVIIIGATLVGGAFGYFLSPWIVIAPARAVHSSLRQVPMPELVAATIGLGIGLVIAALLALPISRLPEPFGAILPFVAVIIFGYLGAAVLVTRHEDFFNFLRFGSVATADTKSAADHEPTLLLDSSVIIDGRIADIAHTGFLLGKLVVPRFVLNEVQYIADSPDAMRRSRGRRGLEVLDKLQSASEVTVEFIDLDPVNAQQVDDKLVSLALQLKANVVTNDYNLNRVAKLRGVKILNVNELANAVKSVFLPGEEMSIRIIQEGKESGQGVGYLEDGTMVVVENGRRFLNQELLVQVTKVLQTNAGRMIFAVPEV
jgi:uncharacterized protein YacL